jgi:uncharacterized coiled-coil protein SlyX
MTDGDQRDGLIARIRQVRRLATVPDRSKGGADVPPSERVQALEARIAHLERLVEGLQDSVHRESERHARLIAELQAQVEPGAMSAALADDARSRGL